MKLIIILNIFGDVMEFVDLKNLILVLLKDKLIVLLKKLISGLKNIKKNVEELL